MATLIMGNSRSQPELKLPPVTLRIVPVPGHIVDGLPEADDAGVELTLTVTVTDALLLTHEGE